ncbi:MAG: hypothetical protein ACKVZH_06730 [Blastocatellia bacterium]
MIQQISVKFDDRNKDSQGWFASFYDQHNSEIFQETSGYPTRKNAFRAAINEAKKDAKKSHHEIAGDVTIHVYSSITDAVPSIMEHW